jgi:hypothetical protein
VVFMCFDEGGFEVEYISDKIMHVLLNATGRQHVEITKPMMQSNLSQFFITTTSTQ